MLKIINLSENLLTLINITKKTNVVGNGKFNGINKILTKLKNLTVLPNININIKTMRFLISKASIVFTQLRQKLIKSSIF